MTESLHNDDSGDYVYRYSPASATLVIEWARPAYRKGQVALKVRNGSGGRTSEYVWIAADDVVAVCDAIEDAAGRASFPVAMAPPKKEEGDTIKPGDTVRFKEGIGGAGVRRRNVEVLAVHKDRLWGIPAGGSGPLTYKAENVEKAETFFEVGKTYIYRETGQTFEPTAVETGSDDVMVAFGKQTSADGRSVIPTTKYPASLQYWEVK